jgi:hypothetical protein
LWVSKSLHVPEQHLNSSYSIRITLSNELTGGDRSTEKITKAKLYRLLKTKWALFDPECNMLPEKMDDIDSLLTVSSQMLPCH